MDAVLAVDLVIKESVFQFHNNEASPYLKITVAIPRLIAAAKRLLGDGKVVVSEIGTPPYEAYESNVDFEVRCVSFVSL